MKASITITFEKDHLKSYTDQHLVSLWHVTQANPAQIDDPEAGDLAEQVGREIIRRFIALTPPPLWDHQGRHYPSCVARGLRQQLQAQSAASVA